MMLKAYILTEIIDHDKEKLGIEYTPELKYTESWINTNCIEIIVSDVKEDVYIITMPENDITAKIHKDEIAKL